MSAHPLVSVIVPVYNVERYLDACLHSIRQQTYSNIEILVVEDCSTDGSLQLLEPHLADTRVRLLRHERNGGLSAARNTGIEAAQGAYVMFVDSDDVVDTTLVAVCVETATRTGAQVVLYGFTSFPDGRPVPTLTVPAQISAKSTPLIGAEYFTYPHFAWLKFIQLKLLRKQNILFPVGVYYEDWPFHWELGFVAQRIERINTPLYAYRQRSSSITGAEDRNLLHIFASHILVAQIAEAYAAQAEPKGALANKIYRGTWFVLNNIRREFLGEAILHASVHLSRTQSYRRYGAPGLKIGILLVALRLPGPLALAAVTAIRSASRTLSSLRRDVSPHASG